MLIGVTVTSLLLGGLKIRAVKDTMYEHAKKMLTSEVRGILKSKSAVSPVPTSSPSPESEFPQPTLKTNGHSSSEDEGVSSEDSGADSSESDGKKKNSGSEKENAEECVVKKDESDVCEYEVKSKVRKHLEEVQQMSSSEGTPQTSDGESSGGREVKRIIGNEAVARRRQAAINRQKEK